VRSGHIRLALTLARSEKSSNGHNRVIEGSRYPCGLSGVAKLWTGSATQGNGFSVRYADGGGAAGITNLPGLDERVPRDIGIIRTDALYPGSKPFWKE
jgi:hypothetical protein